MKIDAPHMWPFAPAMSSEQQQRWLDTCYVKTNIDELFADPARSIVVLTHSGCGVTTSLARLNSYGLFCFQYNPDQWPGQPQAFTDDTDHFSQWMAHIAYSFTEKLRIHPDLLDRLAVEHHEFLIWLMRRFLNPRRSRNWLQYLKQHLPDDMWQALNSALDILPEQMYGNTVAELFGQIDECLMIAKQLGWKGIYASIDIHWSDWISRSSKDREILKKGIQQLLATLTPLQRPGFGFKMGLPQRLLSVHDVRELTRGRATVAQYEWGYQDLSHIATQLIGLADENPTEDAARLAPDTWTMLDTDLTSIWDQPGPAAAIAVARQYLLLSTESASSKENMALLRQNLYRSSAKLYLDHDLTQRQVWRGMTPLTLEETPFHVFEVLWRHQGTSVSNETLIDIAGTKMNLDKIISRIRKAVEPFYEQGIYLYVQRRPSSGTWLDKEVCDFA
jgi:hypothetical protein